MIRWLAIIVALIAGCSAACCCGAIGSATRLNATEPWRLRALQKNQNQGRAIGLTGFDSQRLHYEKISVPKV